MASIFATPATRLAQRNHDLRIAELRRIGEQSRENMRRIENSVYAPRRYRVIRVDMWQRPGNVKPVVVNVGDIVTSAAVVGAAGSASWAGITRIRIEQGPNAAWMRGCDLEIMED